jgi:hypothetical protein
VLDPRRVSQCAHIDFAIYLAIARGWQVLPAPSAFSAVHRTRTIYAEPLNDDGAFAGGQASCPTQTGAATTRVRSSAQATRPRMKPCPMSESQQIGAADARLSFSTFSNEPTRRDAHRERLPPRQPRWCFELRQTHRLEPCRSSTRGRSARLRPSRRSPIVENARRRNCASSRWRTLVLILSGVVTTAAICRRYTPSVQGPDVAVRLAGSKSVRKEAEGCQRSRAHRRIALRNGRGANATSPVCDGQPNAVPRADGRRCPARIGHGANNERTAKGRYGFSAYRDVYRNAGNSGERGSRLPWWEASITL